MEQPTLCQINNQSVDNGMKTPRGKTENSVLSHVGHSFRSKTLLGSSQIQQSKSSQKKGEYVISYNFDHNHNPNGITHNIFIGWDEEPTKKTIKKVKSQQGISVLNSKTPVRNRLPMMNRIVSEEQEKENQNPNSNEPTKRIGGDKKDKYNSLFIQRPHENKSKQCSLYQGKGQMVPKNVLKEQHMPTIHKSKMKDRINESLDGKNGRNRNSSSSLLKPIPNPLINTFRNSENEPKERQSVRVGNQKQPPNGISNGQRMKLSSFSSNKDKIKNKEDNGPKNVEKKQQYRNGKTIEHKQVPKISARPQPLKPKKHTEKTQKQEKIIKEVLEKNQKEDEVPDEPNNNLKSQVKNESRAKGQDCGQFSEYGADTLKLIQDLQKMESESNVTKSVHQNNIQKQIQKEVSPKKLSCKSIESIQPQKANIGHKKQKDEKEEKIEANKSPIKSKSPATVQKSKPKQVQNTKQQFGQRNSPSKNPKSSQMEKVKPIQRSMRKEEKQKQNQKQNKMKQNAKEKPLEGQMKQKKDSPRPKLPVNKMQSVQIPKEEPKNKIQVQVKEKKSLKPIGPELITLSNREMADNQHQSPIIEQKSRSVSIPKEILTQKQIHKQDLSNQNQLNGLQQQGQGPLINEKPQIQLAKELNSDQKKLEQVKEISKQSSKPLMKEKMINSRQLTIKNSQISLQIASKSKRTPESSKRIFEKKQKVSTPLKGKQKRQAFAKQQVSLKIQPSLIQKEKEKSKGNLSSRNESRKSNKSTVHLSQNDGPAKAAGLQNKYQAQLPIKEVSQDQKNLQLEKEKVSLPKKQDLPVENKKPRSGAAIHRTKPIISDQKAQEPKEIISKKKSQTSHQNQKEKVIASKSPSGSKASNRKQIASSKQKRTLSPQVPQNVSIRPQVMQTGSKNETNSFAQSDSELQTTPISDDSQAPKEITCISKKSHSRNSSLNIVEPIEPQKQKTNLKADPKTVKVKQLRNASVQMDSVGLGSQKKDQLVQKTDISIGTSNREIKSRQKARGTEKKQMVDQQVQYVEMKAGMKKQKAINKLGEVTQEQGEDNIFSFANITCEPKIDSSHKQSFLDIGTDDKLNNTDFIQSPKLIQRKFNNSNAGSPCNKVKSSLDRAPILEYIYGEEKKAIQNFKNSSEQSQLLSNQLQAEESSSDIISKALRIILQIDSWLIDRIIEPFLTSEGHNRIWLYCKGQWKCFKSNNIEIKSIFRDVIYKALNQFYGRMDEDEIGIEEIVRMITGLRVMQLKNKKKLSQELQYHIKRGNVVKGISVKPQRPIYSITDVQTTPKMEKLIRIENTGLNEKQKNEDSILWIKEETFQKYFDYFLLICYRKESWWTSKVLKSSDLASTIVYTLDCLESSIGSLQLHSDNELTCKMDLYREVKPKILKFVGSIHEKNKPFRSVENPNSNLCFNFTIKGRYYLMVKVSELPANPRVHLSLECSKEIDFTYLQSIQNETLKNNTSEYIEINNRKMKSPTQKSINWLGKSKCSLKDKENSFYEERDKKNLREQFIEYLMEGNGKQAN